MKNLLLLYAIMYTSVSFAQVKPQKGNKIAFSNNKSFTPPLKLLNKKIWERVSHTRFECHYLRLAVEYQDSEYVLYEMDGAKRELSRAREYSTIGREIAFNTFRVSPDVVKLSKSILASRTSQ
jgi:hypothetical protein